MTDVSVAELAELAELTELVDSVGPLVCGLACDGRIVRANRRALQITRLGREAVIGNDWRLLFACRARHEQLASLWASTVPGRMSPPFEALSRTGKRLRWQFSYWARDPEPGLCAVGTDVTEERDAQARSKSSDRVAAFANLGAGLAHELRNPLNGAHLQLTLLARKLDKLGPSATGLAPHVDAAVREIGRTAAILDDFLVFARPQELVLERAELGAVIQRAVEQVRPRAAAAGVRVTVEPGPPVTVELCVARVADAVHHLAANAVDASRAVRAQTVMIRSRVEGNAAVVEVEDHGPGLAAYTPVFEPYFTTKPNGTGLGLAIVERVAVDHGGSVEFERIGDATVFRLKLPIISGVLAR